MTEKKVVDWELARQQFEAGVMTTREIGRAHGVSHTAVHKCAKKRGWVRGVAYRERERAPERAPLATSTSAVARSGFIYVVAITDTAGSTFYKIGLSASLHDRMGSHQCSSPFEVRMVIGYWTPNMRAEERTLHAKFSEKRVRGEWFALDREDLETIAKRSLLA